MVENIQVEVKGIILNGEYKNWNIFIENLDNGEGGYLILITAPDRSEGYDDYVESFEVLKKYFQEAQWEIQWPDKTFLKSINSTQ